MCNALEGYHQCSGDIISALGDIISAISLVHCWMYSELGDIMVLCKLYHQYMGGGGGGCSIHWGTS